MKKVLAALLALTLILPTVSVAAHTEPLPHRDGVGMSISGFSTQDFYHNTVTDAVLSDSVITVFNIWATWCMPCLGEMPDFKQLNDYYQSTPEADVQLFGVLYDYEGHINEAIGIVEANGYDWTQLLMFDEMYAVGDSLGDYSGLPVPQTIIVDSTGTVRAHWLYKFWDYNEMFGFINGWYETVLAEQPVTPPPTEEPLIPGDADGDGAITIADAVLVLRMAMGVVPVTDQEALDLDGDGSVTIADAVSLLRTAMGLI